MGRKGSGAQQNVRQRKNKDGKLEASKKTDDESWRLLEKTSSKSKINPIPIILGGVLIVLVMLLSTLSGPIEQEETRKNQPKSLKNRELKEDPNPEESTTARLVKEFKVLRTTPHDTTSFTQGLTFRPDNDSMLYESTGMYNQSVVRMLDLNNGQVLKQYDMPEKYFGEGLSYFRDESKENDEGRLIQITWKEKTGFILDLQNLNVREKFSYKTTTMEGWGITHVPTDNEFIVSDGSAYLHFWDMKYQESRPKVQVTYQTEEMAQQGVPPKPLLQLNELEWDPTTRTLLANVWFHNVIVRIDPRTGCVLTIYDLSTLYTDRLPSADVFNGIALNSKGELWVTGKYWPYLYQIELGKP